MADVDMDVPMEYTMGELELLSKLLYSECRGEPIEGQYAVAQCVIDRANNGKYGKGIKGVILKPSQFAEPGKLADNLLIVARESLEGRRTTKDCTILYFRRTKDPNNNSDWHAPFLFRIGNHAFYGYHK